MKAKSAPNARLTATPADFAHIDTWVFDLDNTLYPYECRLFDQVSQKITAYVSNALNLDTAEAKKVQRQYFVEHGTTLKGLMVNHGIDPNDYLPFVHNIDYSNLPKTPQLRQALEALPGRKLIFTAASVGHCDSVLSIMGLEGLFDGMFDIQDSQYHPKPKDQPYDLFFEKHEIIGEKAVFFEDSARNLEPAKKRGMATVFMENDSDWAQPAPDADYIDFSISDLNAFLRSIV